MDKILEEINGKTQNRYSDLILNKFNVYAYNKQIDIVFLLPSDKFDEVYNEEYRKTLDDVVREIVPVKYKVNISVRKTYDDEEVVKQEVINFFQENYPALSTQINKNFLTVTKSHYYDVVAKIPTYVYSIVSTEDFKESILKWLSRKFSAQFEFTVVKVADDVTLSEDDLSGSTEVFVPRVIEISEVEEFIGAAISKYPSYICESMKEISDAVVCGKVTNIQRKVSQKGNTFYTFTLTDPTGSMKCLYFLKNDKGSKMESLADESEIVVSGSVRRDLKYDTCSFWVQRISYCKINWETKLYDIVFKDTPHSYVAVKPEPYTEEIQNNIFERKAEVPEYLKGKTFVAFDLETTGKEIGSCRILEIGAIKIEDGVFTEQFDTFVRYRDHVSEKITELTSITDEQVFDAPKEEDVLADFKKFTDGAILVGHNSVDFDVPILRRIGREVKYSFDNEVEDTLVLARKFTKGAANFKLSTLAEHYGIVLENAHRANADVLATAKLFVKLAENL